MFGLGAGLLGVGAIGLGGYALDRAAADVSSRRRQALGLGVSYGSLSAYDLNFSRFGLGDQTLGNVATGIYDVTSPQFLPLLTSGAATGDTASAAVQLIKSIPEMLRRDNVQDGNVGVYAHSHGWDQVLDLQTIIRLKNASPEEIQRQIQRYEADQKTLDISAVSQEKWSSFDTALERAGRRIETVLAGELAPLAEPLTHLSESAVHLIDAFVNSGTLTKGLGVVETGLEGFGDAISGKEFRENGKRFLSGIAALTSVLSNPVGLGALGAAYLAPGVLVGALVRKVGISGALALINGGTLAVAGGLVSEALNGKLWAKPTGENKRLAQNLHLEPEDNPSLRHHTWGGPGTYRSPIDPKTGNPVPRPQFKYSPITGAKLIDGEPDISYVSTYPRKGEPLTDISGFIWHHTGSRGTPEDIVNVLNQRGLGVQYVMARDGTVYHTLPEGTRGAHILPSEINNLSNSNTEGMEVIALDDKDVTPQQIQSAREFAAAFSKTHPGVQYFGHGEVNPSHKQASEGLTIADAVRFGIEPTVITSTSSPVPLEKRTLMNFASGSVDADDSSSFRIVNRPSIPAARGIDPHLSAGHLTVYDYTGGATTVTTNNVHTAQ